MQQDLNAITKYPKITMHYAEGTINLHLVVES